MRFVLAGVVVPCLLWSGVASAAPAPLEVSFSRLPAGWHLTPNGTRFSDVAISWSYRPGRDRHGWAGSMPRNGIAVVVFFPPKAMHYRPLKPVLPRSPSTTLEGAPDTPEYRIRGRVLGRDVEIWVDIRRPRPTAAQLRTAQLVVSGIRFAR